MAKPVDQLPWHDSGEYRVHFSTFTSDFLQPKLAQALGFSRANDHLIVNIALTKKMAGDQYSLGLPATVEGSATNLMQQQRQLTFTEVSETGATYYLADLRFTDNEVMHFAITLHTPTGEAIAFKFTRTLYVSHP